MRWFWIDRFTEFVSGSHAVAVKGVSLAEDHVHEYQPGYPMHPNSLVIEGVAHVGDRLHGEVQLLFARMGEEMQAQMGARLFRPRDLQHWLELVGLFEVGVKKDGTRLKRSDYPLDESLLPPTPS